MLATQLRRGVARGNFTLYFANVDSLDLIFKSFSSIKQSVKLLIQYINRHTSPIHAIKS